MLTPRRAELPAKRPGWGGGLLPRVQQLACPAKPPAAEPVESPIDGFAPDGATELETSARPHEVTIPPPLPGRNCVRVGPRVSLRFTRGYIPQPHPGPRKKPLEKQNFNKGAIMTHRFVATSILAIAIGGLLLHFRSHARLLSSRIRPRAQRRQRRSGSNSSPLVASPAVAMVQSKDGKWLFTANQRSGSISTIDLTANRVTGEVTVGQKLADLAITPDNANLVAIDEGAGELIVLGTQGPALTVKHRLKLSPTPISLQLSPDGSRCTVASLWPRQMTIVALGIPAPSYWQARPTICARA